MKQRRTRKLIRMVAGDYSQRSEKSTRRVNSRQKEKKLAKYLFKSCSDSGECLAFGRETENFNEFFDFPSFRYSVAAETLSQGNNGLVQMLSYQRKKYRSNAVMKMNLQPSSDNLAYEYLVGQFLNDKAKLYPCFIHTYGLYMFEGHNNITLSNPQMTIPLAATDVDFYKKVCQKSKKKELGLLIQYLNVYKENNLMKFMKNEAFLQNELLYVLFQIYMPLAHLGETFTHYDLHAGNVLLYNPWVNEKGKTNTFIQYHYHLQDGTITSFKSRYLVKIIDYGRCYFYENEQNNSQVVYNHICRERECGGSKTNYDCGFDVGFQTLNPESYPGYFYHISSHTHNISHDMRLLFYINTWKNNQLDNRPELNEVLDALVYEEDFGTQEVLNPSPNASTGYIYNVYDAFEAFNRVVNLDEYKNKNEETYRGHEKLGDLHIYTNGDPMIFYRVD